MISKVFFLFSPQILGPLPMNGSLLFMIDLSIFSYLGSLKFCPLTQVNKMFSAWVLVALCSLWGWRGPSGKSYLKVGLTHTLLSRLEFLPIFVCFVSIIFKEFFVCWLFFCFFNMRILFQICSCYMQESVRGQFSMMFLHIVWQSQTICTRILEQKTTLENRNRCCVLP